MFDVKRMMMRESIIINHHYDIIIIINNIAIVSSLSMGQSPPLPERPKPGDGSDSEDEAIRRRKELKKMILSRSFKFWGGMDRAVSKSMKCLFLEELKIDGINMNITAHKSNKEVDMLFWIFLKVRARGGRSHMRIDT